MAETILAGKNVEEFLLRQTDAILFFIVAVFAPLAENFFLRNRPGDRADSHRQNYKPENLFRDKHCSPWKRFSDLQRLKSNRKPQNQKRKSNYCLPSKNAFNLLERDGWRSFRSALASIWRMRSRVTAKCCPTSSSVCSEPVFPSPKRILMTFSSRGVSVARTSSVISRKFANVTDSDGF